MHKRGKFEKEMLALNKQMVGIDEVGRGCVAGPVFAACVSLNYTAVFKLKRAQRDLLRDSKQLSTKQRQSMLSLIDDIAIDKCIGISTVREIERFGIVDAIFLAMRRALNDCKKNYDLLLVDGNQEVTGYHGEQVTIIKGDFYCFAIAAASIVAKEARDDFMRAQATLYPAYGFENHVGYSTREHLQNIEEFGICPLHRRNFAPISKMVGPKEPLPLFADEEPSPLFVQL